MTDKERDEFLKIKRRQEAFKTAICQAFQKTGECRYGNECRFAHDNKELRLPKNVSFEIEVNKVLVWKR